MPEDQIEFNRLLDIIKTTYELYGFTPLDTPDIELSEVLLAKSGGDTVKQGIDSSELELLAHTISQILTDYQPEVCGKNISSVRQSLGDEIK